MGYMQPNNKKNKNSNFNYREKWKNKKIKYTIIQNIEKK
jgi:hypothetical protein